MRDTAGGEAGTVILFAMDFQNDAEMWADALQEDAVTSISMPTEISSSGCSGIGEGIHPFEQEISYKAKKIRFVRYKK